MSQKANSHNKHLKVLDLDKYEFDGQDLNDRWQTEVEEQLTYQFKKARQQSVQYRDKINLSREKFVTSAAHNTVLINGDRGTGKSYFLSNIEVAWQDSQQVQEVPNLKKKLHFCRVIDPTLLNHHDNFSNVIIAHLYNEVREQHQQNYLSEDFNRTVRELAEALEATDGASFPAGIDRIIGYRSAVDIELRFHRFIAACLQELGVDMLVLPIDDVDMELSRAHEVLEEIRRLLSCPMILPVVSGNIELFQELMESHFRRGAVDKKKEFSGEVAQQLATDYLVKVFPHNSRVSLDPVEIFQGKVILKEKGQPDILFAVYEHELSRVASPFTRTQRNQLFIKIKNVRELIQEVRTIPISLLSEIVNSIYPMKERFWREVKNLAFQHKKGMLYMITDFELEVIQASVVQQSYLSALPFPNISRMRLFSPELQNEAKGSWMEHVFDDVDLGESYNTFIPFPPKLSVDERIFISANDLKKMPKEAVSLFTYSLIYSRAENVRRYICFGRAFELLIGSLLTPCFDEGKNESESTYNISEWLWYLSVDYPFFTQENKNLKSNNDLESDALPSEPKDSFEDLFGDLVKKLMVWEKNYKKELSKARAKGMGSLCYFVFEATFKELAELKSLSDVRGATLESYLKRFEYIVINAFGKNLLQQQPLHARIGLDEKHEHYIANSDSLPKVENRPTFVRNVKKLTGDYSIQKDGVKVFERKKGSLENAELLQCIWNHPIFTCMTKWSKKENKENKENKEILVGGKRKTNEFIEFYQLFTGSLLAKRRKYVTSALYEFLGARFGFEVKVFRTAGKSGINALRERLLSPNYRDLDTTHGEVSRQANVYLKHLETINSVVTEEHECGGLAFYAQSDLLKDYCALVERAMQEEANANSAN